MVLTTGSLLLAIALLVLVGLFIGRPLLVPTPERSPDLPAEKSRSSAELEQQKESLLAQIRELDFDHETGKIAEAPYRQRRQQLAVEAARLLRELDELAPVARDAALLATDAAIERAISARRDGSSEGPSSRATVDIDRVIEAAISRRRQDASGNGGAESCPSCGEPRDLDDRFCAYCGQPFN